MTCPLVSFIVPTLNRRNDLRRFLQSADAQRDDRYEVVVVDQGTDAVGDLASQHRHVRYLRSCDAGLSRNRNVGLRHASGEWLVFADDDCVLGDDYMRVFAEDVSPALDHPNFGFGNAVSLEDGLAIVPTFRAGRSRVASWASDTLCSISLLFTRHTVQRAGGFDEAFGLGARFPAGEETDLLLRLCEAGGRGTYCRRLTVMHPKRSRSRDLVDRYEVYGYAHGALARKHLRNRVYLMRFVYGLSRTLGALVLAGGKEASLRPLYRASLGGKLRGFRAYGRSA